MRWRQDICILPPECTAAARELTRGSGVVCRGSRVGGTPPGSEGEVRGWGGGMQYAEVCAARTQQYWTANAAIRQHHQHVCLLACHGSKLPTGCVQEKEEEENY